MLRINAKVPCRDKNGYVLDPVRFLVVETPEASNVTGSERLAEVWVDGNSVIVDAFELMDAAKAVSGYRPPWE